MALRIKDDVDFYLGRFTRESRNSVVLLHKNYYTDMSDDKKSGWYYRMFGGKKAEKSASPASQATPPAGSSAEPVVDTGAGDADLILGLYRQKGKPISGGMGKVFRVHHTAWNVDLAMK